ncbi:MAG: hypothetical protein ACRDJV_05200 [Actinomycetota bacterium]
MDRERLATWGKGSLVVILIAQLLALLIIFRGESQDAAPNQPSSAPVESEPSSPEETETPTDSESPDEPTFAHEDTTQPAFGGTVLVNSQAGYRLRYPQDWQVEEAGTVTEISSPDGKAVVTFGLAPAGSLYSASRATVAAIQDQHADAVVTRLRSMQVGRRSARSVEGKATNADGVRLMYRSVTVAGKSDTFAILAWEAADADRMRTEIDDIIATFRQTRSRSGSVSAAPAGRSYIWAAGR